MYDVCVGFVVMMVLMMVFVYLYMLLWYVENLDFEVFGC